MARVSTTYAPPSHTYPCRVAITAATNGKTTATSAAR
jgi:hypothetical protein